jgi:hypothetical protein
VRLPAATYSVATLVKPMRFPRSKYLGLFLVGCLLAALGWGMQAYVDLVRLEAAVVDARARVETASRIRLELVENLLRDAQAGRGAEALTQVDLAAMRVRDLGLLPAALDAEGCPTEFLAAQDDLTAALDAVWAGGREMGDRTVELAITDLRPEIQRWSATLDRGMDELNEQLQSFRSSAVGFPGSLIAAIPRREGPTESTTEAAARRAEVAASGSGAIH